MLAVIVLDRRTAVCLERLPERNALPAAGLPHLPANHFLHIRPAHGWANTLRLSGNRKPFIDVLQQNTKKGRRLPWPMGVPPFSILGHYRCISITQYQLSWQAACMAS